ncbi:MAG: rhodanese-like domain-containing protein [Pseudomonadota bacterium]|nr:rhodanese-like domain-containing protein [Pseudomonadota bacterium]
MRFIKPINLDENSFILDVRQPEEHAMAELALPHVNQELERLDPLEFIRQNNISPDKTINILCSSGGRASQAAEMFEQAGFDNVAVVIGGLVEAEYEGVPVIHH